MLSEIVAFHPIYFDWSARLRIREDYIKSNCSIVHEFVERWENKILRSCKFLRTNTSFHHGKNWKNKHQYSYHLFEKTRRLNFGEYVSKLFSCGCVDELDLLIVYSFFYAALFNYKMQPWLCILRLLIARKCCREIVYVQNNRTIQFKTYFF